MGTIRTLVLSGGGGRGAFHAGVYQYLMQRHKPGVNDAHQGAWQPDIVVGTSIGAVNGAAIVQGIQADDLLTFWRSLRERDIQGLPPYMSGLSRWVANKVMKNTIGVQLPQVAVKDATSPKPDDRWEILPGLGKFGALTLGRWMSLLDTGPLRRTLETRLGLKQELIEASRSTLLINATNVSTGQRVTFSNQPIYKRDSSERRSDVHHGITVERILASCSIPLLYPWTRDEISNAYYWDGAVVANTPLGVSLDAANLYSKNPDDKMEVVVVLMTPWRDDDVSIPNELPKLPGNFTEAITWVLDWALLASFRERLDLIDAYNKLARIGRNLKDKELSKIREVEVMIVAPQDFFPAARIIDYDEYTDTLIRFGYEAAECVFQKEFSTTAKK
jgi:NTE family protein